MGDYGKPFSTELFAKKDYSKELDSGIFMQIEHFETSNHRNIFNQVSIRRDYRKSYSRVSAE